MKSLRKQSYIMLVIIRLVVGVIRFVFDLPAFFAFLRTGKIRRV